MAKKLKIYNGSSWEDVTFAITPPNTSVTNTFNTNQVIDTSTSVAALRVTQRGTGEAFRVEDDSNPDASPFVITATGDIGIGTSTPQQKLAVTGNIHMNGGTGTGISWASDQSSHYLKFDSGLNGIKLQGYAAILFETLGQNERMRIMSNGKVTIGTSSIFTTTTSTTAKLTVISDSNLNDTDTNSFISLRNKNNTNATTIVGGILSDTYRDVADPHYSAGMWFIREPFSGNASSSGEIAFGTGGNVLSLALPTERMRIDSEGNVSIGHSAPNAKLEIRSANAINDSFGLVTVGSNNFGQDFGGQITFSGVFSSDNNQTNFGPFASVFGRKENGTSGDYAGYLGFGTRVHTGAVTERARINSAGYMLLGYTSSNGAYRLQVNSQIFATSASIATSDGRYKENVLPINSGLSIVNSLNPVSFDWKEHPVHNFPEGKTVGFIAQEVQEALSGYEWVNNIIKSNYNEEADEEFLGIAESNIIPLLVAALKEVTVRLEALESK